VAVTRGILSITIPDGVNVAPVIGAISILCDVSPPAKQAGVSEMQGV